MTKFVIVEVGSTNTKAYLYDKKEIQEIGFETIEFKNHYKEEGKISSQDKELLFHFLKKQKEGPIFVYGTSIFRN